MSRYAVAYLLFLAAHAVPGIPGLRTRLIAGVGRRAYLTGYSLLSLALLVFLIASALAAPSWSLWPGSPARALVPVIVMPFASILFVGGALTPNPFSISFRIRGFDPQRPGMVAVTRHPILWAFLLWSGSHVIANGDVVAVSLFGGLALYSLAGMWLVERRARTRLGGDWDRLTAPTSRWPFGAQLAGRARWPGLRDLAVPVVLGLIVYAALLFGGHAWLFGVAPLDLI